MQRAIFCLLLLVGVLGQQINGGSSITLTSFLPLVFSSISVGSTATTTFTAGVSASTNLRLAGQGTGNGFSITGGAAASFGATFTSSATTTLTVTASLSATTSALLTSGSVQFHLLLGSTDASGQASFGAVPVTINGGTYTYTLNVIGGQTNSIYFAPLDASLASTAKASSSSSTSGSSSFDYNSSFFPVALNQSFSLSSGTQYAFGNNIQVTPSGSNGGKFSVTYDGGFNGQTGASSSSSAPANTNGNANAYWYFNGDGNSNVLQWKSTSDDSKNFFFNGNSQGAASFAANASAANSLSWYKANADSASTQVSANAWAKVSSTSQYIAASGNTKASVAVYTTASTYSQWTVGASGSGNGAGSLSVAVLLVVAALASVMF